MQNDYFNHTILPRDDQDRRVITVRPPLTMRVAQAAMWLALRLEPFRTARWPIGGLCRTTYRLAFTLWLRDTGQVYKAAHRHPAADA